MKQGHWILIFAMALLIAFGITHSRSEAASPGQGKEDFDYPHADLRGKFTLQEGCEEQPSMVGFDITSLSTLSGESANFPMMVGGMTDWEIIPPMPADLLGTYALTSLVGTSKNFMFGTPRPLPTVYVNAVNQAFFMTIEIVPTTTRLTGVVTDQEGQPQSGVLIELTAPDGQTYRGRSRSGGDFAVDLIGLGEARRFAEADVSVLFRSGDSGDRCGETRLPVHLKAGVTERRNVVLEKQGALRGSVLDNDGSPVDGARISLYYADGRHFETATNDFGTYEIRDIPEGTVDVVAVCPKKQDNQSRTIKIKCEERLYQSADFTLKCDCPVSGLVLDTDGGPVSQARVALRPAQGKAQSTTAAPSGYYAFKKVHPGSVTITATCPRGKPSRSVTVPISCPEEGHYVPLTLDCKESDSFHLIHTASAVGDCTFSYMTVTAKGESFFTLPAGAKEVQFTVPYTMTFRIDGKSGPGGRIEVSPASFALKAQVQWTIRRKTDKGKACLTADLEIVGQGEKDLLINTYSEQGDLIYNLTVQQPAIASPGWRLGSGRFSSCEGLEVSDKRIEVRTTRSDVPLCLAPPTVAALVTGESGFTEHILIEPVQ